MILTGLKILSVSKVYVKFASWIFY